MAEVHNNGPDFDVGNIHIGSAPDVMAKIPQGTLKLDTCAIEEEEEDNGDEGDEATATELHDREEMKQMLASSGLFIDFIIRNEHHASPMLQKLLEGESARAELEADASVNEARLRMFKSFQDAMNLMHFERLQFLLRDLLTEFWKRHQHPCWALKKDIFRKLSSRIVLMRQKEKTIHAQLREYESNRKQERAEQDLELLAGHVEEDHQQRVKGFWDTFHRGARKGETRPLTPQKTELCLPALHGGGWIQPKKTAGKAATAPLSLAQTNGSGGSSKPWVEGMEHKHLGMTDMNWKFRAARGPLCSHRPRPAELDPRPGRGMQRFGHSSSPELHSSSPTGSSTVSPKGSKSLGMTAWDEGADEVRLDKLSPTRPAQPSATDLDGKTWWWQSGACALTGPFQKKVQAAHLPTTSKKHAVDKKIKALGQSSSLPELRSPSRKASRGGDPHSLIFGKPLSPPASRSMGRSSLRSGSQPRTENKIKGPALPPIKKAVVPPHGHAGNALSMEDPKGTTSPTKRYIHACSTTSVVPMVTQFVTGHSSKIDAAGKAWRDGDLLAMCAVGKTSRVEDCDLSGSTLLSDRALGVFMEEVLHKKPTLTALKSLNLNGCAQAGRFAQDSLVRLLGESEAINLRRLDIGGVQMSMRLLCPLCEAVSKHHGLEQLDFSNTGLGYAVNVKQCLQYILSSQVKVMDLGWNSFGAEELQYLGECLVANNHVTKLSLVSCAASSSKHLSISPCVYFLEQLARDKCLESLDISMNRIDLRGALVIEDALEHSRCLTSLNVSMNPLGVRGLRCLLRLLSRDKCGLMNMNIEHTFTGELMAGVEGIQVFNYTNPGGHYVLDLERPYHRSLLRTLYRQAGGCLKLQPADTFFDLSYNPGSYAHPSSPDSDGVWQVPNTGVLEFSFSIEKVMEKLMDAVGGSAKDSFTTILSSYNEVMRFTPSYRKLIPLLALWSSIKGRVKEQNTMLAAMGRDFIFTETQLKMLAMEYRPMAGLTVARLLPCCMGGDFARSMVVRSVDNPGEFIKGYTLLKEFLLFNPESPTGHYWLDLGNTASAFVAEALALLDRWESGLAKRKEMTDISENGDYSCVRNVMYEHMPLSLHRSKPKSFDQWVIPEKEELELDYVTNARPCSTGKVLDEQSFSRFMNTLQHSKCDGGTQIQVTRQLAHFINLSSLQMRRLLGVYKTPELRADALVCTFFRIVDIHNEKIFRVRYEEQSELDKLRDRLGYCTFFPYMQPEQVTYSLDFAKYDQRLAANMMLSMANAERRDNIANPSYTRPDGTVDLLPLGLPRSWDKFAGMPKEGVFRFTYKCSPEDRKFSSRKSLQETYGKWKAEVLEDEVTWWAAPNEAPEDVLEFVFWMKSKWSNTDKAFVAFDGPDGNGVISIREFEEGMKRLKCRKFKGKDEKQRFQAIFRYLDPSGEGQVSKLEFMTLDLFWEEVKLSIVEFLDWAERMFGRDLEPLWNALDEDESGSIQRDEWEESLDKVGYFGPSGPIFSYVDEDDEGTMSWDEFQILKDFQDQYMNTEKSSFFEDMHMKMERSRRT